MGKGLQNVCKLHGEIRIQGRLWVWDYVADRAVPADELRENSERWYASQKARAEWLKSAQQQKVDPCP